MFHKFVDGVEILSRNAFGGSSGSDNSGNAGNSGNSAGSQGSAYGGSVPYGSATTKYKIFLNEQQKLQFTENMKLIVDSVLSFVRYNIQQKPVNKIDISGMNSSSMQELYRMWNSQQSTIDIRDLVVQLIPDPKCKGFADRGIIEIDVKKDEKAVSVLQAGILSDGDVAFLQSVLQELLFSYYDIKVLDAKKQRNEDLLQQQDIDVIMQNAAKNMKYERSGGRGL